MKDDRLYIVHMLECIERITSYTRSGKERFLQDTMTQDVVLRNFEIIGEAAKRVSSATRDRSPDIPWRQIAGFRDVLIHQYEGTDLMEVWKRAEHDVPVLQKALSQVLKTMHAAP